MAKSHAEKCAIAQVPFFVFFRLRLLLKQTITQKRAAENINNDPSEHISRKPSSPLVSNCFGVQKFALSITTCILQLLGTLNIYGGIPATTIIVNPVYCLLLLVVGYKGTLSRTQRSQLLVESVPAAFFEQDLCSILVCTSP